MGGSARRALAGTVRAAQARRQATAPARAARAAQRSAARAAKGVAKARKQSGIAPGGAGTPAAGRAGQGKALRRSALRHGARMAGSAALAAGVGLLSGLWNIRKPGRAAGHMRGVWSRLAGRARMVRERRDAAIRGTTGPGQVPVPGERVNDPRRPERTVTPVRPGEGRPAGAVELGKTTREGERRMSEPGTAFVRLSDSAEVMLQAASTFDPEVMPEFQHLIEDLPTAMEFVQETLRVLAEIAYENLPVNDRVVEEMSEGYRAMRRVVDALEEVPRVYYRVHEADIDRQENPRKGIEGERKWNV
ncbi:hypothetical protein ACWCZ5_12265 [Streptomyces sp. NPDC001667]